MKNRCILLGISSLLFVFENKYSLSAKVTNNRLWWFCNVSTWLEWTTFPRIPFPLCCQLELAASSCARFGGQKPSHSHCCRSSHVLLLVSGLTMAGAVARPATAPPSLGFFFSFSSSWARWWRMPASPINTHIINIRATGTASLCLWVPAYSCTLLLYILSSWLCLPSRLQILASVAKATALQTTQLAPTIV